MMVVYEAESQGNILRLFHHGYISIESHEPHFGFQLTAENMPEFIAAMQELGRKSPDMREGDK